MIGSLYCQSICLLVSNYGLFLAWFKKVRLQVLLCSQLGLPHIVCQFRLIMEDESSN